MIGQRCVKCKRQRGQHHSRNFACPIGRGMHLQFHANQFFEARPPRARSERVQPKAKRGGSEGRKDRATRRAVKAEPCVACGAGNCDPAHVRGWQISQCDEPWNLVSQCRAHHNEQGRIGWFAMGMKYPGVAQALKANGWEFLANESTGDWSMFNPLEVEFNRKRRAV